MRKNTGDQDKKIQVLSRDTIEEHQLPPIVEQQTRVIGNATDRAPVGRRQIVQPDPDVETTPPEVKFYEVMKGGPVRDPGGFRTVIRTGKIIDSLNFNIQLLKQQGIQVQETDQRPQAGLGY